MGDTNVVLLAAEAGGGTSNFLVPNGTFFVVLIIFLIVLGVIGTFVVPPITKVLRERDAMVTKTAADNKNRPSIRRRPRRLRDRMAKAPGRSIGGFATRLGRKAARSSTTCVAMPSEVSSTLQQPAEQFKREG